MEYTSSLIKIYKKYPRSTFTIDQIISDNIIKDVESTLNVLVSLEVLELIDGLYNITSLGHSVVHYETVNGEPAVESANSAAPNAAPLNAGLPPKMPD